MIGSIWVMSPLMAVIFRLLQMYGLDPLERKLIDIATRNPWKSIAVRGEEPGYLWKFNREIIHPSDRFIYRCFMLFTR